MAFFRPVFNLRLSGTLAEQQTDPTNNEKLAAIF